MSPLSCPLGPAPAPKHRRMVSEGRMVNTYIEPISSEQSRQNSLQYMQQYCSISDVERATESSGMSKCLSESDCPPPLPARNYTQSIHGSIQSLQSQMSVAPTMGSMQSLAPPYNSMVSEGQDSEQDTIYQSVSMFSRPDDSTLPPVSGPWNSPGAMDLWPSSIEQSTEEDPVSADEAFLEESRESNDSWDQLSTRHNFTVSFKVRIHSCVFGTS